MSVSCDLCGQMDRSKEQLKVEQEQNQQLSDELARLKNLLEKGAATDETKDQEYMSYLGMILLGT